MPIGRKILFIDDTHPFLIERLNALGFECDERYNASKEELEPVLGQYSGLVIRSRWELNEALLSRATNLAFIARYGVGVEHIDLDYASRQNILVLTSPEGSRDTVAEHTIGLLLSLLNHLNRADRQVRLGQWIREANRGVEIKGKTVGILGYGNMGTAFAQRLKGFDCRVIAYDKYKTGYGDDYAEAVDPETLFRETDFLSIHIPYIPENHYFIDGAFLHRFAKNIYLVNTARGLVLHTADLVLNLQSGKVLGAALDVIEYEETSFADLKKEQLPEPFHDLIRSDNVVLSPHIAGWSVESKLKHAQILAQKIEKLFC